MPKILKKFSFIPNLIFPLHLLVVFSIAFGALDRFWILPWSAVFLFFIIQRPLTDGVSLFVRSLPVFVALPLTGYFDSFNLWRLAAGILFLKWFFSSQSWYDQWRQQGLNLLKQKFSGKNSGLAATFLISIFLLTALFSLFQAAELVTGVKRIIYLINLLLIAPVIFNLVKTDLNFAKRLMKDLVIAGLITLLTGLAQLTTAYLGSIYAFMNFWGEVVQKNFYGSDWAAIAVQQNTWFAYFGNQLSLRVFSTFPDAHSFPVFLLFVLPSFLTLVWQKKWWWLGAAPFLFFVILSGTRGIWLASAFSLFLALGGWLFLKNWELKKITRRFLLISGLFLILFLPAWQIFGSSQFQVKKADGALLLNRFRSTFNPTETSNQGRLEIWRLTLKSINKTPLTGVGIGNFPVILSQAPEWAKAGSSAHNFYLQLAAEVGIIGLLAVLAILWLIIKKAWQIFSQSPDQVFKIYGGAFLFFFSWILTYNLTDAILFDERAFLALATNGALIFGLSLGVSKPKFYYRH